MTMIFATCMVTLLVALVQAQYQGGPSYEQPQYEQAQPEQYQQPAQEYQQPKPRSFQQPQEYQPPQQALPLPAILTHKQALSTDGAFNYAFSADNGLKQGETINPDGSRAGSYSYVDPTGNTIKVRYTAGKDGFRVLEGDHLPKAPAPAAPQYSPQPAAYSPPQPAYSPPQAAYSPPPQAAAYQPQPARQYSGYDAASAAQYQQAAAGPAALFGGQRQQQPQAGGSIYSVQDNFANNPAYQSTGPATFPAAQQQPQLQHYAQGPQRAEKQIPHSFGGGYSFEFGG